MRCLDCATTQPGHARFCGFCGARLGVGRGRDERARVPSPYAAAVGTTDIVAPGSRRSVTSLLVFTAVGAVALWWLTAPTPVWRDAGRVEVPEAPVRAGPQGPVTPGPRPASLPAVSGGPGDCVGDHADGAAGPCTAWTVTVTDPLTRISEPVIDRDRVFIAAGRQVVALDAASGQVLWATDLGAQVGEPPGISSNRVYVVDDARRLTALDRWSGAAVWQVHVGDLGQPAITREVVVLSAAGRLRAFSRVDGRLRWEVTVSGLPSPPAVVGDSLLVVGDGQGDIRCIDGRVGEVLWQASVGGWNVAASADSEVVLATGFGSPLVALDLATGERRWTSSSPAAWGPAVLDADGRTAYAVSGGRLRAFDVASGRDHPVTDATDDTRVVGTPGMVHLIGPRGEVRVVSTSGLEVGVVPTPDRADALAVGGVGHGASLFVLDEDRMRLAARPVPSTP